MADNPFRAVTAEDVLAGLITPVVVVTSTLSYVALIFSGPLVGSLPHAIGFGLVSAALMAIIFALGSKLPFAVAGPDSKPSTVLAIMAAIVASRLGQDLPPEEVGLVVLAALVVGTLATGIALFALGALRMGRWIRFVPYPVVGGFMAASGWLLAVGGLGLLAGTRISPSSVAELGAAAPQIVAGLVFAGTLWLVQRSRSPFGFPIALAGTVAVVHVGLALTGISAEAARADRWLLDIGSETTWTSPLTLLPLATAFDANTMIRLSGEFLGLVAVTVVTLLLSLVVIEVNADRDVDVDRELRLNGLANIAVGLCGGMVGTISVSRTLLNYRLGARNRSAGMIAGAICAAVLFFGSDVLTILPLPVLGGLLFYIGGTMLYEWVIGARRSMPLTDFLQVVIIMLAIVFWDFLAGVVIGVVAACVTFAINTGRIRPVRQELDRASYRSRVDRPVRDEEALYRQGKGIQILWLHGFVFFGSAHRLLADVRRMVEGSGAGVCRYLILDFRNVLGIDTSAVLNLGKLWNFAKRENFTIALSSVSADVEKALATGNLVSESSEAEVFPDLDAALEWCEDNLVGKYDSDTDHVRSADDWLANEIGGSDLFARLASYLEKQEYEAGTCIFEQGATARDLVLLHTGRATVLLESIDGPQLRLRSMVGPTVLGENGFYRNIPRGASVMVDQKSIAYRLSSSGLQSMEDDDPQLACAFHKFIVRVVSSRLDFANREIAGLHR
jgi:sulfate permease, SulP family